VPEAGVAPALFLLLAKHIVLATSKEPIVQDRLSTSLKAVWIGFVALATNPAIAADMSTDELRQFLIGRTYYLETTAGGTLAQSGQAILYFAPEGGVINRVPSGKIQQGAWTIKDNTVCVVWKDLPPNPCSRYDRQGDLVTVINVQTGQPRGKIIKSADGNVEGLKP
jgi:hypothetical protein